MLSSSEHFEICVERISLQRGDVFGIVGPSGSGKSTLLDLLALLRAPTDAGEFRLLGIDVLKLWLAQRIPILDALRARNIGVVLQTGGLIPALPVLENVMLGRRLAGYRDTDAVRGLLESLGLSAFVNRLPAQLSVGQRQRVAIARAVANEPRLILADEPTAALGRDAADSALRLLTELARHIGAALVVVSHDLPMLERAKVPIRTVSVKNGTSMLECWP
jgi:putative ABC transport system ATP-binding protein